MRLQTAEKGPYSLLVGLDFSGNWMIIGLDFSRIVLYVPVCQLCMWLCGFDDDSMKNSQYNENFAWKLRMFSV